MKRFLTLFLAVLMVVLVVPVMAVSADDTVTAVSTDTAASIDGTKDDAVYTGEGVPVGDNATAYFAYDMTAIYVFVDVTDSTKSDAYYSKAGDSSSVVDLIKCGVVYFNRNDTVVVGLCYGKSGSTSGTGVGQGEHAGVVGVYRPVGSATSNNTVEHDYETAYGGGEGAEVAAVDKADGSGYTAELKLCFTDAFPAEAVLPGGCKMLVQVADSNSTTVAEVDGTTFSNSIASYSAPIYKFQTVGHYGNNYGTLVFEGFETNNKDVVTVPAITVPIVTPLVIVPIVTTPAETTPAETTTAETTPAETTPVETTPAATTPEETTPAETTAPVVDTPAESSAPVGLIIGIVVAVLVVAAVVVVVVLKKKGNKA